MLQRLGEVRALNGMLSSSPYQSVAKQILMFKIWS